MGKYRKEKIGSVVREIVSEVVSRRLHDPRIAPLTTITRVELTADLLLARVYVSVYGDEAVERRTLAALRHAEGFVQRIVAHELSLRQCPEIRFEVDESWKRVKKTMELLDENRRSRPELLDDALETEHDVTEEPDQHPQ